MAYIPSCQQSRQLRRLNKITTWPVGEAAKRAIGELKARGENVEQMEVVKTRANIFRWKVKKGWLVDICLAGYVISQGVIAASDNIEVFEVRIEAS